MTDRLTLPLILPPAMCVTLLAGALFGSCTGTETDNPVLSFKASDCKRDQPAVHAQALQVGEATAALTDSAAYAGLYCFAWKVEAGDRLALDVYNATGDCFVEGGYQGRAQMLDGALELRIRNPTCIASACGACIYDFNFELEHVRSDSALHLKFGQEDCDNRYQSPDQLSLPIDRQKQGVVCRPVDTGTLTWLDLCAGTHLPCAADSTPSSRCSPESVGAACEPGLVCTEDAKPGLCLQPCTTDGDCQLSVESCQAGVCQVHAGF